MPALLTPEQQSTLAEPLRRREAPAEEEFVHLFSNRIALFARTRTGDSEDSRDLTQEVMLAVVHALRNGHLRALVWCGTLSLQSTQPIAGFCC